MSYPETFRYTKEHEWVAVDGDIATVGITDYAQKELGDVVFVELPEIGKKVKQGEPLGSVESVKAVSDVYSPVSGEVVEINTQLQTEPQLINQDPHGKGWIARLKIEEPDELAGLMTAGEYEKFIQPES